MISVLITCMDEYAVFRYRPKGNSIISLYYEYLLGATTVRAIVRSTFDAIWEFLLRVYKSAR